MPSDARNQSLDFSRGLLILLVVIGHISAREVPHGSEWYRYVKLYIYSFHMPLFMFISGAIFFLRPVVVNDLNDFFRKLGKRISRLYPAYIVVGLLVILGKFFAAGVVNVDNPIEGLQDIYNLFFYPPESAVGFLWFVHVLVLINISFLLWICFFGCGVRSVLSLGLFSGLVSHFFSITDFMALDRVVYYIQFFAAGLLWVRFERIVKLFGAGCLVFFSALFVFAIYYSVGPLSGSDPNYLVSIVGIPFLVSIAAFVRGGVLKFFSNLGLFSFVIYLLNVPAIGFAKAILMLFFSWEGFYFNYLFFPVLIAAGVIFPVVLKKTVFDRSVFTSRLFS